MANMYIKSSLCTAFNSVSKLSLALVWLLAAMPMNSQAEELDLENTLLDHPSPYLALHGNDPVDWQSWNKDVFDAAKESGRLVLVSIGYFSCHWCHVMQRESYQNDQVAEALNGQYISVKIDRELRPDLDQRLIEFVESIRGSAGWPLNVFLTPEGYPVTGFTYLPRENFLSVLNQLDQQWRAKRDEISQVAETFFRSQMAQSAIDEYDIPGVEVSQLVKGFIDQSMTIADQLAGGFGDQSKFPQAPQLLTLMTLYEGKKTEHPQLDAFLRITLDAMAGENLRDHVYGGFFRYTTDPDWQTPHYEKMLYDNAQLALVYRQADRLWPGRGYKDIADKTLAFVETYMKHPQGGYMSSLSAVDHKNVEGGDYLWEYEALGKVLSAKELKALAAQNSEVVNPSNNDSFLIPDLRQIETGKISSELLEVKKALIATRPLNMPIDDKRLASWNGLMLKALSIDADDNADRERRADDLYAVIRQVFFDKGELIRFANRPDAGQTSFQDYADVAEGFYQYGITFDKPKALEHSAALVEQAYQRYFKDGRWILDVDSLVPGESGEWVMSDAVINSPLSTWLRLALDNPQVDENLRSAAVGLLGRASRNLFESPFFYGSYVLLKSRPKLTAAGSVTTAE